jgi:hypothetical protein
MTVRCESSMSRKERSEVAAADLNRACNVMNFDYETFANEVRREHRTIQQNTARVLFALIERWAGDYESGNFDLRNEDTVRACKDIVENVSIDAFNLRHI